MQRPVWFHNFAHGEYFSSKGRFGPCFWPYFNLFYLRRGCIEFKFAGSKKFKLKAGECLLIYPNTSYYGKCFTKKAKATIQRFGINRLAGIDLPWSDLIGRESGYDYFCKDIRGIDNILDLSVDMSREPDTELKYSKRLGLLAFLLAELMTDKKIKKYNISIVHQEKLIKLEMWMRNNMDKNLSIDKMAEYCGMSNSYFRDVFTRFFGFSPKQFFLRLRMQHACSMLAGTSMEIKGIAYKLGYREVSSFYKAFERHCSLTPGKFRQKGQSVKVEM